MRLIEIGLVAALGLGVTGTAHAQGDPAAGARGFDRNCGICHSAAAPAKNRWGPALLGVVGRPAGAMPGYKYSKAMLASGVTWTPQALDAWLTGPRDYIPGVKMGFRGLKSAQERADIIAFLATRR